MAGSPTAAGAWFEPGRIALVGATERSRFTAQCLDANARLGRSSDDITLVNQRGEPVFGRPALADLSELGGPIDAAVLLVPARAVRDAAERCLAAGASHLVVHASGFERRDDPDVVALVDVLRAAGATMVGPNCMGWLNLNHRFSLYGGHLPSSQGAGPISFVVQSGSAAISCLNAGAGLGIDCLLSTGNELVTTLEDCVEGLIDRPQTEVIALYVEQLRDPKRFLALARRAARVGTRIVVLKTGRSAIGARMSQSHTGALAGEAAVYSAAFRDVGVLEASTFEEFFAGITLSRSRLTSLTSARTVYVGISGGELSHVVDVAEAAGVPTAELAPRTEQAIGGAMGLPGAPASANPIDIGARDPKQRLTFAEVQDDILRAVEHDDGCDLVALAVNFASTFDPQQVGTYAGMAAGGAATLAAFTKPGVVVSAPSIPVHADLRHAFDAADVPVLRGTRDAFAALAGLVEVNRRTASLRAATDVTPAPADPSPALVEVLQRRRAGAPPPTEHETKALLHEYGILAPAEAVVATPEEAAATADRLGYPVVVKVSAAEVSHKSDIGGVILDLRSPSDVIAAVEQLDGRLAEAGVGERSYLVCSQVSGGVELILGARFDRDFGPIVAIGAGGVLVELLGAVELGLAPRTAGDAMELLDRSPLLDRLLGGYRGDAPIDRKPVAEALVRLGELVGSGDGEIADVEVNPLVVFSDGRPPVALDARLTFASVG